MVSRRGDALLVRRITRRGTPLRVRKIKKKPRDTIARRIFRRLKKDRRRSKRDRARLSKPLQLLTSTKTTAVLGATLGAVSFPAATGRLVVSAIPKSIGGKLLALTGLSALTTSPKLRELFVRKLNPISSGRELGRIVEDPSKLFPKDTSTRGIKEKIFGIGKTAGIIGGVAAAGVGAAILGRKAVGKVRSLLPSGQKVPPTGTIQQFPTSALTGAAVLPAISTGAQPLGAVQKPVAAEPPISKPPTAAIPSIKITNKPQNNINIRFSKSRKFINQQVLVKQ